MDRRDKQNAVMEYLLGALLVKIELLESEKDVIDFLSSLEDNGLGFSLHLIVEGFVWEYYRATRDINSGSAL